MSDFPVCATCAVEHAEPVEVCAICADERQYVPEEGQQWTTLDEMVAGGVTASIRELEPDLFALTTSDEVGIGQTTKLVRTPEGMLLWDPLGFIDDDTVDRVRELGAVTAIVASHPHMFGVQVEWSRRLGGVPVLVAEADREWVARPDAAIQTWSGDVEILPGVTLSQPGGHFPGSAIAHWAGGAGGRGLLLCGDTVYPNPDLETFAFLRSYPNRIPLSAAVVERITAHLERFDFEVAWGNFDNRIPNDARAALRRSAERHKSWVSGEFDHLT